MGSAYCFRLLCPSLLYLMIILDGSGQEVAGEETQPWLRNSTLRSSSLRVTSYETGQLSNDGLVANDRDLHERDETLTADSLSLPLQRTGDTEKQPQTDQSGLFGGTIATVVGALAITLGLFCIWVAVMRRGGLKGSGKSLPREALEIVGQTMLGPKEKVLVLRCGMQALVVGVTPAGMQTLAQIDDPDEAGQFIASCRGMSATRSFQKTIHEMEREPIAPGFLDAGQTQQGRQSTNSAGSLFLRA